jgi:hypothetical protein
VGNGELFASYLEAANGVGNPQKSAAFRLALGDFRNPDLVEHVLQMCVRDGIPAQDIGPLLQRLLNNPSARVKTWTFIQKRWRALERRIPPAHVGGVIAATPALGGATHRKQVAAFFRDHPPPSGDRALRQALETFDWYRGFRRRAGPDLDAYLHGLGDGR